jgi:hypothetical protein
VKTWAILCPSYHVKYNLHELEGLSFALKQYAIGNVQNLGYVKFTNSNNTSKVVSLLVGIEKQNVKGEEISNRVIALNVSSNNNGKRIQLTCDNAHAMAETIHQLYLIGCQHEFSREVNTDSYDNRQSNNASNSNSGGNKTTSFGNSSFNDNGNSSSDDDNSSFLGGQFGGGNNFGGGNPFS